MANIQKDTKLETARWKQMFTTLGLFTSFAIFFVPLFLFPLWFMDGYVTSIAGSHLRHSDKGIFILGLGELLPFSFAGSLFCGGILAWMIANKYKHPTLHFDNIKREHMKENVGALLSEGERIARGSRLNNGPWQEVLERARKDGIEAGKHIIERRAKIRGGM